MKKGQIFSVPGWVYLICVLLSLLLFFCTWQIKQITCGYDLSMGILASTVVAAITDMSSTRIARKKDWAIYNRIISNLKNECEELISEVHTAALEVTQYENESKLTFAEWIDVLTKQDLNGCWSEKQENEIKYLMQKIASIRRSSQILMGNMSYHYDNDNFHSEFEKKLKKISLECDCIARALEFESHKRWTDEMKKLGEIIPSLFEELTALYTQKYNEEEYMD